MLLSIQIALGVDSGGKVSLGPVGSTACSSYFIEPVEWMEELLLGAVEGKVRTGEGGKEEVL